MAYTHCMYDYDNCAQDTTLGFDVVQNYMEHRIRLGTYSNKKIAQLTADIQQKNYLGLVVVINR